MEQYWQYQPGRGRRGQQQNPMPQQDGSDNQKKAPTPHNKRRLLVIVLVVVVLVAVLGAIFYFVKQAQDLKKENERLSNPTEVARQEQADLITKVGALAELPEGETPTVATVSDINKLKDQEFFANAENGDRILIYTEAKKAYLYRPSTNKLINVAPVSLGENTSGTNTED